MERKFGWRTSVLFYTLFEFVSFSHLINGEEIELISANLFPSFCIMTVDERDSMNDDKLGTILLSLSLSVFFLTVCISSSIDN